MTSCQLKTSCQFTRCLETSPGCSAACSPPPGIWPGCRSDLDTNCSDPNLEPLVYGHTGWFPTLYRLGAPISKIYCSGMSCGGLSSSQQRWIVNRCDLVSDTAGARMGRRKSKRKPEARKKNIEPMDTQFTCPFCNHEKSCEVGNLASTSRLGFLLLYTLCLLRSICRWRWTRRSTRRRSIAQCVWRISR